MGLIALISGFFLFSASRLDFDYQFDKLYPANDPETILYKEHVQDFDVSSAFMYLILTEDRIFDSTFLKSVDRYEKSLNKDTLVEGTVSPVSLKKLIKTPFGLSAFPLLGSEPEKLKKDSIYALSHPFYSQFFSQDQKSLIIYLTHKRIPSNQASDNFLQSLRTKALNAGLEDLKIVGPLEAQNVFVKFIQNDFQRFLFGSVILSFGLLMLIFRDLKSALLPFIISVFSVLWLFGLMSAMGFKVNLLSALLPPVIFFVAMSDVIHLMNAFKKTKEKDKWAQLTSALKIVWRPTLLTSITTAIGFLSLLWINTVPIQEMGVFAAIGILIPFILTFTLGVVYVLNVNIKSYTAITIPKSYGNFLLRKKRTISAIVILFVVISIPGVFMIDTNAYILDDLPSDTQVRQDFDYANEQIGGAKTWEMRIEVVDPSLKIWDKKVMLELHKLDTFLARRNFLSRVQSPLTAIKMSNSINQSGLPAAFEFPKTDRDFERAIRLIQNSNLPVDNLVTDSGKVSRILGFVKDVGTSQSITYNEEIDNLIQENIDENLVKLSITGPSYLIDKTNQELSFNLFKGLATALVVIAIFLGVFFESWKLLLISLIPNLLPLLTIAGIVGLAGISLKMTTAIVFTVAFGIAVDDTIHFMSYYIQNRHKSNPMQSTFLHAGSAMLITSIVITSGFALFLLSDFGATFYMGLFVSLALVVALIIDFTLLPLLLRKYLDK